jgi:hypothetical protein
MQTFSLGYRLMDGDLNIEFQRKLSFAYGPLSSYNPFTLYYEIGTIDSSLVYTRMGPTNRIPYEMKVGHYRANFIVGDKWPTGTYRITWTYQVCQTTPVITVSEDFMVDTSYSGGTGTGLCVTTP